MLTSKPLHTIDCSSSGVETYLKKNFSVQRKGTGLPLEYVLGDTLQCGTNNRVSLLAPKCSRGPSYVVRSPRSESDTRVVKSAILEFMQTSLACYLNVAPNLYDAWYCDRDKKRQGNGLHLIMDHYPLDMHSALFERTDEVMRKGLSLGAETESHLYKMATHGMLSYDLKSSNMLTDQKLDHVKIIDFGSDFCEVRTFTDCNSKTTPVLNHVAALCSDNPDMYAPLIFHIMMILLSSNMSHEIEVRKRSIGLVRDQRHTLNYMRMRVSALRRRTTPKMVRLIKRALRHDDLRDHIRHYNGKLNSSVKMTFSLANFVMEDATSSTMRQLGVIVGVDGGV